MVADTFTAAMSAHVIKLKTCRLPVMSLSFAKPLAVTPPNPGMNLARASTSLTRPLTHLQGQQDYLKTHGQALLRTHNSRTTHRGETNHDVVVI